MQNSFNIIPNKCDDITDDEKYFIFSYLEAKTCFSFLRNDGLQLH